MLLVTYNLIARHQSFPMQLNEVDTLAGKPLKIHHRDVYSVGVQIIRLCGGSESDVQSHSLGIRDLRLGFGITATYSQPVTLSRIVMPTRCC
jgi:hypothetical protein